MKRPGAFKAAWQLAGAIVISACRSATPVLQPALTQVLEVRNRSFFDVNVYALQSSLDSRIRLGSVTGFSTATFPLTRGSIRPDGSLTLYVRAIGSRRSWISPSISLSADLRACLDVYSSPTGDLSARALFTVIVGESIDTGATHCSPRAVSPPQHEPDAVLSARAREWGAWLPRE